MFFLAIFLVLAGYLISVYTYALTGYSGSMFTADKVIPFFIFVLFCFFITNEEVKAAYETLHNIVKSIIDLPWYVLVGKIYAFLFK